jgi:hypothetical protein
VGVDRVIKSETTPRVSVSYFCPICGEEIGSYYNGKKQGLTALEGRLELGKDLWSKRGQCKCGEWSTEESKSEHDSYPYKFIYYEPIKEEIE